MIRQAGCFLGLLLLFGSWTSILRVGATATGTEKGLAARRRAKGKANPARLSLVPPPLDLSAIPQMEDVKRFCENNLNYGWLLDDKVPTLEEKKDWTALHAGAEKQPFVNRERNVVVFASVGMAKNLYPEMLSHAQIFVEYMKQPEDVRSRFEIPKVYLAYELYGEDFVECEKGSGPRKVNPQRDPQFFSFMKNIGWTAVDVEVCVNAKTKKKAYFDFGEVTEVSDAKST
uniref:Uncharacterized protein n=1 Tax=Chromera velia CCMP2878 TaxID=1169474 RepID=A0A0G4GD78_9ALVE|eukprot:Cvel_4545.t1-p1 / transcript=Cvel_4545.t1 / gene=Cvel_4545 / organism=Chromera_velia_CCMP2878 / gene_product=hypothetical protein / transcript_product=hypothetical protein / location=Cvel_scaffold199:51016-52793(-) / protein_length=229 / sequence_SO=supercontig / SO=protein_coding / is_pseudo=false